MDKQLIERLVLEEKAKLSMFGMDKTCVDLVTRCLARIDAEVAAPLQAQLAELIELLARGVSYLPDVGIREECISAITKHKKGIQCT